MSVGRKKALEFAHQNRDQFLEELIRFAAIPSISTDPGFKNDVECNAEWLSDKFSSLGVVTDFQQTLSVNVVNIGFGMPTDNMHGPYEKLDLPN